MHAVAIVIAGTFLQAMGGAAAYVRGDEAVIQEMAASFDVYAALLEQGAFEPAMSQRQYLQIELAKYGKREHS